jgi:hypothetical protein
MCRLVKRVAANILNKQSSTADKGWSSGMDFWSVNLSHRHNIPILAICCGVSVCTGVILRDPFDKKNLGKLWVLT